jgi:hypothetical protein
MKRQIGVLLLFLVLFPAYFSHAQGCSMCRDTTVGSAPQMRQGLRKAIPILGIPAAALFLGILLFAGKTRPGS